MMIDEHSQKPSQRNPDQIIEDCDKNYKSSAFKSELTMNQERSVIELDELLGHIRGLIAANLKTLSYDDAIFYAQKQVNLCQKKFEQV